MRGAAGWCNGLLLAALLLAGCGGGGEAVPADREPAAQVPAAEASPVDGLPAAELPAGNEAAVEAEPAGESVPPPLEQVQVFLVRLAETDGEEAAEGGQAAGARRAGGATFGCGDRLVGVKVPVATEEATTADQVAAAVRFLLASGGGPEAPGNLYNALERSSLEVAGVRRAPGMEEDEGIYRVELTGNLRLGGVCDNPRVGAQLRATAEQFAGVEEAEIYLNGRPLEAVLTGR